MSAPPEGTKPWRKGHRRRWREESTFRDLSPLAKLACIWSEENADDDGRVVVTVRQMAEALGGRHHEQKIPRMTMWRAWRELVAAGLWSVYAGRKAQREEGRTPSVVTRLNFTLYQESVEPGGTQPGTRRSGEAGHSSRGSQKKQRDVTPSVNGTPTATASEIPKVNTTAFAVGGEKSPPKRGKAKLPIYDGTDGEACLRWVIATASSLAGERGWAFRADTQTVAILRRELRLLHPADLMHRLDCGWSQPQVRATGGALTWGYEQAKRDDTYTDAGGSHLDENRSGWKRRWLADSRGRHGVDARQRSLLVEGAEPDRSGAVDAARLPDLREPHPPDPVPIHHPGRAPRHVQDHARVAVGDDAGRHRQEGSVARCGDAERDDALVVPLAHDPDPDPATGGPRPWSLVAAAIGFDPGAAGGSGVGDAPADQLAQAAALSRGDA